MIRSGLKTTGLQTNAIRTLLLALLTTSAIQAQTTTNAPPAPLTVRHFDPRIQYGIDLIYSLQFAQAEAFFDSVMIAEPDNPVGYFFRAMTAWWRVLIDLDDHSHDEAFYQRLDRCIEICDQRLKEDPNDFDAILFKGGSIGFRGRLRGDRGQYLKAANDGRRCLPLLKHSRALEPDNKDILFGQGIYNYFADVIPEKFPIVKPIMWLLPDGDKEQGIRQLEQVAKEGRYARTEAIYFLAQIYRLFEKDNQRAQPYMEALFQAYPQNALFHRYLARVQVENGHWEKALPLYTDYIQRYTAGQTGYHKRGRIEAHYYIGRRAFMQHRLHKAIAAFVQADSLGALLEEESSERMHGFIVLANLYLGRTYDLLGQREKAIARYRRVKKLKKYKNTHKMAALYLKNPYTGQQ
jgi:hypothetical protein